MSTAVFEADAEMDGGRVRVHVTRARAEDTGTLVTFSLRDDALGVTSTVLALSASRAELFVLADILGKASGERSTAALAAPVVLRDRAKAWLYECFSGRWTGIDLESLVDLLEVVRVDGFEMGFREAVGLLRTRLDVWARGVGAP